MRAFNTLIAAAAVASLGLGAAIAQDRGAPRQQDRPAQEREDRPGLQRDRERQADETRYQFDPNLQRVDRIHGMTVRNMVGEDIATVDALLVEAQKGQVEFALLRVDGFLGVAGELVAVPWDQFQFVPLFEGLVLDATQERLREAPGFDTGELPIVGQPEWADQIRQGYGEHFRPGQRPEMRDRRQERDLQRGRQPGSNGNPQQPRRPWETDERDPGQEAEPRYDTIFLSTGDVIGMKVENHEGETVGNVDEIVIELERGEMVYAVLGWGGFLGIGEERAAVPWHAFELHEITPEEQRLVLNITKEQLRGATEYDVDRWPNREATGWSRPHFPEHLRPGPRRR